MSDNTEEMNVDSFLESFEKNGAALSSPVLPEGNYLGRIIKYTIRYGIATPSKGPNAGKEVVWAMWGCTIALDSETAKTVSKKDGEILVYAGDDTVNLRRGNFALSKFGIANENNAAFWKLVGSLLALENLAEEVKEDSGESFYKISSTALRSIYANTQQFLDDFTSQTDIDERLIPAMVAEKQLAQLSEYMVGEENTRKVYVHVARKPHYQDKARQEHFVKQIMLPAEFENDERKMRDLMK